MIVLAGDIGGTNTRLVITENINSNHRFLAERTYSSSQYISLDEIIACFLSDYDFTKKIDVACFAVAGPVISGKSKITNLPWTISEQKLEEALEIPRVKLVDDLHWLLVFFRNSSKNAVYFYKIFI